MLQKIIAIKNTGRFLNSACVGDTVFAEHTLIYSANGLGKSTLCAILRSLQTGDSSYIRGRQSLGSTGNQNIQILTNDGCINFNNSEWSENFSNLAIFDTNFVTDNIHAGDIVDTDQKRNLYRIIVGEAGLSLADEEKSLAQQSRTKTSEINSIIKTIQTHLPHEISLEDFLILPSEDDIDTHIAQQEAVVSDIQYSAQIRAKPNLTELKIPTLPADLLELLGKTIHDIATDAERRINNHLATHELELDAGKNWLVQGIEYANETCPFCGQDIQDLSLIAAYNHPLSQGLAKPMHP